MSELLNVYDKKLSTDEYEIVKNKIMAIINEPIIVISVLKIK